VSAKTLPRGIRNNNPGNIERTNPRTPWQGLAPLADAVARDERFEVFTDPRMGIRAIARTLITYQDKHDCNTVREHIGRWAPAKGRDQKGRAYTQDSNSYASIVARAVGVGPDDAVDVQDYAVLFPMVRAMVRHENGSGESYGRPAHWYSDADYTEALRRAGIVPAAPRPLRKSESAKAATVSAGSAVALGAVGVADHVQTAATVAAALPDPDSLEPVQQAAQQVAPMAATGSWLSLVLILVIVGCAGVVVWRAYQRRKDEAGQ